MPKPRFNLQSLASREPQRNNRSGKPAGLRFPSAQFASASSQAISATFSSSKVSWIRRRHFSQRPLQTTLAEEPVQGRDWPKSLCARMMQRPLSSDPSRRLRSESFSQRPWPHGNRSSLQGANLASPASPRNSSPASRPAVHPFVPEQRWPSSANFVLQMTRSGRQLPTIG